MFFKKRKEKICTHCGYSHYGDYRLCSECTDKARDQAKENRKEKRIKRWFGD